MRALIKPSAGPGLALADVPEPQVGPGEVKIRVAKTGLCGTDLQIMSWGDFAAEHVRPGQVIGHEFDGHIVEIGPGVELGTGAQRLKVGAHVSVEGHVVCGRCRNCRAGRRHMCVRTNSVGVDRDGAFADYVVVPADNVWVQPEVIDSELAALFDPFGNAVHTALQFPLTGEDVLITGAGPIGIMAALIARHGGARHVVITDISDERLALAERAAEPVGTIVAVNSATTALSEVKRDLTIREGFDAAMEMSGSPQAMADLIDACTHGAKVALLGLPKAPYPVDWNKVITHMLTIQGVYGRDMYDTWYHSTFLLQSSPGLREGLRRIITHRVDATDWEQAFTAAGAGGAGKVLIDWSN